METPTPEQYGLTNKDITAIKDIKPSFNLSKLAVGERVDFILLEDKPREVEFTDRKTGEEIKRLVIEATDILTGLDVTIWLSNKSLKMSFFNFATQNPGSMKGKKISISKREYVHDRYGKSIAYSVMAKHDNQA